MTLATFPQAFLLIFLLLWGKCSSQINENWASYPSSQFRTFNNHGVANYPVQDAYTQDGYALDLTLYGNPAPGPGNGPAAESIPFVQYGTYWTRMKTADCSSQPGVGVVTGFFTYFNNGSDLNGNGLPDNSELDFEWLCAQPEVVYLSIWTDYSDSNFRQAYRAVNIKTGQVLEQFYHTNYGPSGQQPLSRSETQPTPVRSIPNYDPTNQYYRYGWIFSPNRIQFIMSPDGVDIYTLWDYQGPSSRIPKNPMKLMYNVWHTNSWTPKNNPQAIQSPWQPVTIAVDWSRYNRS